MAFHGCLNQAASTPLPRHVQPVTAIGADLVVPSAQFGVFWTTTCRVTALPSELAWALSMAISYQGAAEFECLLEAGIDRDQSMFHEFCEAL
jgi:hypothetical protein